MASRGRELLTSVSRDRKHLTSFLSEAPSTSPRVLTSLSRDASPRRDPSAAQCPVAGMYEGPTLQIRPFPVTLRTTDQLCHSLSPRGIELDHSLSLRTVVAWRLRLRPTGYDPRVAQRLHRPMDLRLSRPPARHRLASHTHTHTHTHTRTHARTRINSK